MRRSLSIPLLIFFCLLAAEARAAQRTLLTLGAFQQWVDLGYTYAGSASQRGGSERSHTFEESYGIKGSYTLMSPRLWQGEYLLKLGLEQDREKEQSVRSSSSETLRWEYDLSGVLFSGRKAALSFDAQSSTERRDLGHTPAFDLTTDSYAIKLSLKNRYLPARLGLQRRTSATRGLPIDRTTTVDTLRFEARNEAGPSRTEAAVHLHHIEHEFDSDIFSSDQEGSDQAEFTLDNQLLLPCRGAAAELRTSLSYRDERQDAGDGSRDYALGQGLNLPLGKALTLALDYGFAGSKDDAAENETRTRTVGASLQHRLFQSLVTRLAFAGRRQETPAGEQSDLRSILGLNYSKRLRGKDLLTLGGSYSYGLTDRDFDTGLRSARDIRLIVQELDNFLPDTGILLESVAVRDDTRTILFVEGIDYLLRARGEVTEIEIPLGSAIAIGQLLSVDYQFRVDPTVRYASHNWQGSGSYSFLAGQLMVFGDISEARYDVLEGEEAARNLNDVRLWRLGLNGRRGPQTYRLSYMVREDPINPQKAVEGVWSCRRRLLRGWWDMQVRDSYVWYEGSESVPSAQTSNNLALSTALTQNWRDRQLSARLAYANSRGRTESLDQVVADLEYVIIMGKTRLSLGGGVNWRDQDQWVRSEHLEVRIRRIF